jgi:uncharacterized repeat protein (TIGR02543 family)
LTFTLSYKAGPGGTLTGQVSQTVSYGASGTAVTAVPSSGYDFVGWSDGSAANPRTDTNVVSNISVTANFVSSGRRTITAVVSIPDPSISGQKVTFVAAVLPLTATGTVTFKDGDTVLGTASLKFGLASFSTSALKVGSHRITAVYAGDKRYAGSVSAPITQLVIRR